MSKRIKNILILSVLLIFLLIVSIIPVTCLFKSVTGISCSGCGMTRAFISIFHFHFITAFMQNILSIPLFIFITCSCIMLFIEIIQNKFDYIPKLLHFLEKNWILIVILLIISFIWNNLK